MDIFDRLAESGLRECFLCSPDVVDKVDKAMNKGRSGVGFLSIRINGVVPVIEWSRMPDWCGGVMYFESAPWTGVGHRVPGGWHNWDGWEILKQLHARVLNGDLG